MVHMRVMCVRGRVSQFNDAAAMTVACGVPFMRWIIDWLRVTQSLKRICLWTSLAVKAYALACLRVLASGRIDLCVFRPPKLNIDILIKRLCCSKPFAPGGVLVIHTHMQPLSHSQGHRAWLLTTVSSFSGGRITDNQRCFSSYCVIVLSDSGRALVQSAPATRLFSGMLMWAQEHNTIIEYNSLIANLLAPYKRYPSAIMIAYSRCVHIWYHNEPEQRNKIRSGKFFFLINI